METKTEFVKFVWTLRVWVESVETSMLERTRLFIKFIYVLNVTEKIHYLPVSGSICCRYVLVWYLCIICVLMFEHMYRSCVCVCGLKFCFLLRFMTFPYVYTPEATWEENNWKLLFLKGYGSTCMEIVLSNKEQTERNNSMRENFKPRTICLFLAHAGAICLRKCFMLIGL